MDPGPRLKPRVFLDTNVLLSGAFFSGNEAKLLSLTEVDLLTSDIVLEEADRVIQRKFRVFGTDTLQVALLEFRHAIQDLTQIIRPPSYRGYLAQAQAALPKRPDADILAAVLASKPDALVTGDRDFFRNSVQHLVRVVTARQILREFGVST